MTPLRDSAADRLIETAVGLSLDSREIASRRPPTSSDFDGESQVLWMVGLVSGISLWIASKLIRR
jgi:hypothetical protein